MAASIRARKGKPKQANLAKRLANLTVGLTVPKVLRLDDSELVIEFEDGTRLLARGEQRLDVSIT
jgi:hypothetical protein